MPISVACRCGKAFAANDNLAGKTVKCPGCQQPLQIPAPASAAAPQRTADGKIVVACGCGAKFAAGAELAGKQVKCPKCGQALTVGGGAGAKPQAAAAQGPAGMITVACQCGARFGAKPELQGRTVACPKCSRPLVVGGAPVGSPAGSIVTTEPAGADGGYALADLLDEVGVKTKASAENACPYCGEFMAQEAVLCVHCGYNRKTGKTLTTQTIKKVEAKKLGPPTAAAKAGAAKAAANPYASPGSPALATPSSSADGQLGVMDWLFVIFCGGIALIVAIIYIVQGNPKGMALLKAWAIVTAIAFVINVGLTLMMIAMQGAGN